MEFQSYGLAGKWRKYKRKTIRIETIREENLTIIARVDYMKRDPRLIVCD